MAQLAPVVRGRLYFILADEDKALEASLEENVVAVRGQITDTEVLEQLDLPQCDVFVAGSREDEPNILAALYAKQQGAARVFARVFQADFMPLVASLGVTPLQTSHMAASFTALQLLKPAVARLVSMSTEGGRFALAELDAVDYPELLGCRLGNLQGEQLHVVAVAEGDRLQLGYATLVERGTKLIVIYDKAIGSSLKHEMRKVAAQATHRPAKP